MNLKRLILLAVLSLCAATGAWAQPETPVEPLIRGLQYKAEQSDDGYTLFAPLIGRTAYLIDSDGAIIKSWALDNTTSHEAYLLDDGSLVYQTTVDAPMLAEFAQVGGVAGRIQRVGANGRLIWAFDYAGDTYQQHHDIEILPNGNVLLIAWEVITADEALAAGLRPDLLPENGTVWPDQVVEVEPTSGDIVWMWRAWDHLIQDTDPSLPNYGVVAEHPERINVNYVGLRRLGDWQHGNSIDYNAELDQIVLSLRHFNEIWIIDHSTTPEEARSSGGGRSGQGGTLLYRWGNPEAYDAGTPDDRTLFTQHDAQWITPGLPGAGHLLIFDNGDELANRLFSGALEIATPLNADGRYDRSEGGFAPAEIVWQYQATPAESLFAPYVSSVQRLTNGNTFIVDGTGGRMLEVTPEGEVVWDFLNPLAGEMPEQGAFGPFSVFRARRYPADHPGVLALDLNETDADYPPNGA